MQRATVARGSIGDARRFCPEAIMKMIMLPASVHWPLLGAHDGLISSEDYLDHLQAMVTVRICFLLVASGEIS